MTHLLSDVGLGILSWRGHETLVPVLESLRGTEDIFGERVIYFNEITDEDRRIASEFGFESFGSSENTGIYGGFRGLAESMKSRYVLLQENDWHLIESLDDARRQLDFGAKFLRDGRAKISRFHHFCRPGYDNNRDKRIRSFFRDWSLADLSDASFSVSPCLADKHIRLFMRYYPPPSSSSWVHLRSWFRRYRHPQQAHNRLCFSPYVMARPDEMFGSITRDDESGFFLFSARDCLWMNFPFMVEREFYLDVILDRVERTDSGALVNGHKNIENEVSGPWWHNQDLSVAFSYPGLFSHDRLGDRGY